MACSRARLVHIDTGYRKRRCVTGRITYITVHAKEDLSTLEPFDRQDRHLLHTVFYDCYNTESLCHDTIWRENSHIHDNIRPFTGIERVLFTNFAVWYHKVHL